MKQPLVAAVSILAWGICMRPAAVGQETMRDVNTAHLDVRYERGVQEADARKVSDFLEKEYSVLRSRLGFDAAGKIEVRIYESVGKFMAETALKKPWRVAIYLKGVLHLQPVSALVQRKLFERSLRYEFARAFLVPAGQKGCPPWLIEAFAVHYANEAADTRAPIGARISAFSDLAQDLQDYTEPPQRDDVHYFLDQTMVYFVSTFGESRANSLFKSFDGNSSIEVVFKKVLGSDYATVEKGWAKAIAAHSKPFKEK